MAAWPVQRLSLTDKNLVHDQDVNNQGGRTVSPAHLRLDVFFGKWTKLEVRNCNRDILQGRHIHHWRPIGIQLIPARFVVAAIRLLLLVPAARLY